MSAASTRSTGEPLPKIVSDLAVVVAPWTAAVADRADAAADAVAAKAEELTAAAATSATAGVADESDLEPSELFDCMPAEDDSAAGATAAGWPVVVAESELPVALAVGAKLGPPRLITCGATVA